MEERETEGQIGDGEGVCARDGQEDEERRDKRAVDHAGGSEIVNNTAYPERNYRRPHSRRCSCNRISWIALNTTGEKRGMRLEKAAGDMKTYT